MHTLLLRFRRVHGRNGSTGVSESVRPQLVKFVYTWIDGPVRVGGTGSATVDVMDCREITRATAVALGLSLSVMAAGGPAASVEAGGPLPIPHRRGLEEPNAGAARSIFHEELSEPYGGVHLVLVALASSVVAALVAILVVLRYHRRRIGTLLARLAQLEAKTGDRTAGEGAPAAVAPESAARPRTEMRRVDVLSGKTDTIRRLVLQDEAPAALVDRAIVYIYRHLRENLTASRLADDLHVSLRTLERALADALRCTPSNLILAVRMREASRLLRSGSWRVNEVAYHVGFSNPSHFSRRFKEYYRVPPSYFIKASGPSRS